MPRRNFRELEAKMTPEQIAERDRLVAENSIVTGAKEALRWAKGEDVGAHVIKLTEADQKVFVQALENPPAPNKKLRAAYKRYKRLAAQKPR